MMVWGFADEPLFFKDKKGLQNIYSSLSQKQKFLSYSLVVAGVILHILKGSISVKNDDKTKIFMFRFSQVTVWVSRQWRRAGYSKVNWRATPERRPNSRWIDFPSAECLKFVPKICAWKYLLLLFCLKYCCLFISFWTIVRVLKLFISLLSLLNIKTTHFM